MSAALDTISEPIEELEARQLEFHSRIRAKLEQELKTKSDLKTATHDTLARRQGNVEMLEWFLKLPQQVLDEWRKEKGKRDG